MVEELIVQLINLPDTYIGEAPVDSDTCQWLLCSSGASTVFFGLNTVDKPEYAVYARASSNKVANDNIQLCLKNLRNWNDGHSALLITRMPAYVGRDEKHRCVYSFRVQFVVGG